MAAIKKALYFPLFLPLFFAGPPASAAPPRAFTFAVMGCAHLGACGSGDYELAVSRIREQKPDFVLFLGGMVDTQGKNPDDSLWREFDRVTAGLGVPVYTVFGDCRLNPLPADSGTSALSKKLHLERNGKLYSSFVYKNSLFILLAPDKPGTPADAEQLEFLRSSLLDAARYDNVFLAQHDPIRQQEDDSEWMKTLRPVIEGKVKYVFNSGKHFFDVSEQGGTTYINSGIPPCMSNETRRASASHFLLVDVKRSQVSISVVPLAPVALEEFKAITGHPGPKYKLVKQGALDSAARRAILPAETVLNTLNIKPGMDIVDIGAGTGFFTFPMAAALNGTGRVFAVDTDPAMTAYINARIEKSGYKNIYTATIGPWLDPFYKQHTFDIMLMSEVYHNYTWNPQEYLRMLKNSLASPGGRLYIIHFKAVPDFGEMELGDFSGPLKILKSKRIYEPILEKMCGGAEEFMENWKGEPFPEAVRKKLLSNLNRLLLDRWLFREIMKLQKMDNPDIWKKLYTVVFPRDLELFKWLIVDLDQKGVFSEDKKELSDEEAFELKTLNRILLTGILQNDRLNFLKGDKVIYVRDQHIIKALESAGFTFVKEHEGLPFHHFLEFKGGGD